METMASSVDGVCICAMGALSVGFGQHTSQRGNLELSCWRELHHDMLYSNAMLTSSPMGNSSANPVLLLVRL
jgi:hypothetical protein